MTTTTAVLPQAIAPGRAARDLTSIADRFYRTFELEAEPLLDAAMAATGLQDWGDPSFRDGLDRLLFSARNDANLHGVGRLTLRWAVQRALRGRLRQVEAARANPAALTRPLRKPIVIAAPPRCGTTLLQRLLAAHPDALSLPLWLALDPYPAPDADTWRRGGDLRRRVRAHVVSTVMDTLMPAMRAIHTTAPDLAVECTWLMLPAFQSPQWMSTWPVHSYAEWLGRQDGAAAYRWLRQGLQILQASLPGSHWVLKAPGHFTALSTVLSAMPEALVVQLHRDPAVFVGSVTSLVSVTHHVNSHRPDMPRTARQLLEFLAAGGDAAVTERGGPDKERFVDLPFADLARDPIAAARVVAGRAGLRWDAEVEQILEASLARHPEGKGSKHAYKLDAWGIEPDDVRRRFAAYIDHFRIPVASTATARFSDQ